MGSSGEGNGATPDRTHRDSDGTIVTSTSDVTVGRLIGILQEELSLEAIGPEVGFDRPVRVAEVSSPGLALAGYTRRFPAQRLQVLGETEVSYLASLEPAERDRIVKVFFGFPIPCVFVTKAQ